MCVYAAHRKYSPGRKRMVRAASRSEQSHDEYWDAERCTSMIYDYHGRDQAPMEKAGSLIFVGRWPEEIRL